MQIPFSTRINPTHDSLEQALAKKVDNHSISDVTEDKLVSIAHSQNNLSKAAGAYIFQSQATAEAKYTPIPPITINDVRHSIEQALPHVTHDKVKTTYQRWIKNCDSLLRAQLELSHPTTRKPSGAPTPALASPSPAAKPDIEMGSRGQVEQRGDRAIKSLFDVSPEVLHHELAACNAYLEATGSPAPKAFSEGGKLNMPYIEGETPTHREVMSAVQELFNLGFMMADPAPQNFKKTAEGKIVPVDFGLIFKRDATNNIAAPVMREIVHDYAKGGFRGVPDALSADYRDVITAMDDQLGNQGQLGRMNVKQLRRAGLF